MTIDRQDTHTGAFYGYKFGSMPEVRYSIPESSPSRRRAHNTGPSGHGERCQCSQPAERHTARRPPPSPLPLPAEPTANAGCADLVYLCDLQLQPVQWLWQDRLASGTLAMISGVPGSENLGRARDCGRSEPGASSSHRRNARTLYSLVCLDGAR